MTDLHKFIDAVQEDSNLRNTLSTFTEVNELAAKAVELGADRDLVFTVEDVQSYLAEQTHEKELSDAELDVVTGGVDSKHCPGRS